MQKIGPKTGKSLVTLNHIFFCSSHTVWPTELSWEWLYGLLSRGWDLHLQHLLPLQMPWRMESQWLSYSWVQPFRNLECQPAHMWRYVALWAATERWHWTFSHMRCGRVVVVATSELEHVVKSRNSKAQQNHSLCLKTEDGKNAKRSWWEMLISYILKKTLQLDFSSFCLAFKQSISHYELFSMWIETKAFLEKHNLVGKSALISLFINL